MREYEGLGRRRTGERERAGGVELCRRRRTGERERAGRGDLDLDRESEVYRLRRLTGEEERESEDAESESDDPLEYLLLRPRPRRESSESLSLSESDLLISPAFTATNATTDLFADLRLAFLASFSAARRSFALRFSSSRRMRSRSSSFALSIRSARPSRPCRPCLNSSGTSTLGLSRLEPDASCLVCD